MFKIAVVEDDPVYARRITEYIQRFAAENQMEIDVRIFADGMDLVMHYTPEWTIVFLDIEMPKMDGLSAAREIRQQDSSVLLIFITNMAQYAIRGYEVEALDFVLKPVSYQQFNMKMHKAVAAAKTREAQYVLLPLKDGEIRVSTREILYIEVSNHHLHISTVDGSYTVFDALSRFEKKLPAAQFSRCSQSYLVNLRHVKKLSSTAVWVDQTELPVSRTRRKAFMQAVSDYFGGGSR